MHRTGRRNFLSDLSDSSIDSKRRRIRSCPTRNSCVRSSMPSPVAGWPQWSCDIKAHLRFCRAGVAGLSG